MRHKPRFARFLMKPQAVELSDREAVTRRYQTTHKTLSQKHRKAEYSKQTFYVFKPKMCLLTIVLD